MCGFVFIYSKESKWLNEEQTSRMADRIAHRGPDARKVTTCLDDNVSMAHLRLSIIDLSPLGQQPMYNDSRDVILLFNGEIYNYLELRKELVELGVNFQSQSDTEVLLRGYEKWGKYVLDKINGMFSFLVFDKKKQKILFVRDRIGVKPLYYFIDEKSKTLCVFSELKSALSNSLIDREIDGKAQEVFLRMGYIPAPLTLYKKIRKVRSAHYHEIDLRTFEIKEDRYWSYSIGSNDHLSDKEISRQIKSLLYNAVSLRMRSDVPVGVLLSGGVDSTLVAGIASQMSEGNLSTFSSAFDVGPRSFKYNQDADIAEDTAKALGAKHTRLNIRNRSDFLEQTLRALYHLDEPNYVATFFTQFLMSKAIRESGVKVVLDGCGGDEVFGGYSRYFGDLNLDRMRRIPAWMRKLMLLLPILPRSQFSRGLQKSLVNGSLAERMLSWQSFFSPNEIAAILGKSNYEYAAEDVIDSEMRALEYPSNQDAMLYFDQKFWLAEAQCMISDRMTMANGVEARSPFLDYRLVEFGMSLSFKRKTKGNIPKYLLKNSFDSKLLPSKIRDRPKTGWFSPVHYWVKDFLWKEISESINTSVSEDFFDQRVLGYIQDRSNFNAQKIWNLFVLSSWQKNFNLA